MNLLDQDVARCEAADHLVLLHKLNLLNVVEARVMVGIEAQVDRSLVFDKSLKVDLKQGPVSLLVMRYDISYMCFFSVRQ